MKKIDENKAIKEQQASTELLYHLATLQEAFTPLYDIGVLDITDKHVQLTSKLFESLFPNYSMRRFDDCNTKLFSLHKGIAFIALRKDDNEDEE